VSSHSKKAKYGSHRKRLLFNNDTLDWPNYKTKIKVLCLLELWLSKKIHTWHHLKNLEKPEEWSLSKQFQTTSNVEDCQPKRNTPYLATNTHSPRLTFSEKLILELCSLLARLTSNSWLTLTNFVQTPVDFQCTTPNQNSGMNENDSLKIEQLLLGDFRAKLSGLSTTKNCRWITCLWHRTYLTS